MYDTYLQSTIKQQKGQKDKEFEIVEWKILCPKQLWTDNFLFDIIEYSDNL